MGCGASTNTPKRDPEKVYLLPPSSDLRHYEQMMRELDSFGSDDFAEAEVLRHAHQTAAFDGDMAAVVAAQQTYWAQRSSDASQSREATTTEATDETSGDDEFDGRTGSAPTNGASETGTPSTQSCQLSRSPAPAGPHSLAVFPLWTRQNEEDAAEDGPAFDDDLYAPRAAKSILRSARTSHSHDERSTECQDRASRSVSFCDGVSGHDKPYHVAQRRTTREQFHRMRAHELHRLAQGSQQ